ncbi:MAG: hypothetical protein IKZ64_01050 [Alphaproteobacteria bacterium]|nr:hypothetical protein [Alphaproteobacteria bacterium]
MPDDKTQQQNKAQNHEEPATVGDLFSLGILAAVVAGIIIGIVKGDSTPKKNDANTPKVVNVDSLVQDSLSKTIEYQNAVRATQELDARRSGIYEYFSTQQEYQ